MKSNLHPFSAASGEDKAGTLCFHREVECFISIQQSIHELLDGTEPLPLRTPALLRQFFGLNALIQPDLVGPKCAERRSAALQDPIGATAIVNSPKILDIDVPFRVAHCPVRGRQASGGHPPNSQIAVETIEVIRMLQRINTNSRRCSCVSPGCYSVQYQAGRFIRAPEAGFKGARRDIFGRRGKPAWAAPWKE